MKINYAHRGSLTEAPENTLASMQKALNHKPKAIELDVQLTKDGHLVVIHDHKFTRFNKNITGLIKDFTLEEIKQIDVGSSFSSKFTGETLATLEETLELIPRDILINVEIKNIPVIYEGIEKKVLDVLKAYNRLENIVISSFDHEALKKIQQLNANIPLGLLFYYRILEPWKYAQNTGLQLASVHPLYTTIDQQFIDQFKELDLRIYPFTVDDMTIYKQLLEMGVDGVFSNNPKIFGA